jgi:cytochrome c553
MRMSPRILLALAGCVLAANVHAAGNPANGAQLSQVCQACHGPDGNGVGDPQYPIIAGQYADYLAHSLKAYRSGERSNVIMQGFAQNLSDQDIADLSAYFASQKSKLEDLSKRR